MTELELILILAGPFGLALVVLGLAFRPWRKESDRAWKWLLAPALAASYVVGHLTISSFPPLPARTLDEWLVYVAIAGGVWGLVEVLGDGLPRPVIYLGRLLFLAASLWLMAGARLGAVNVAVLTVVALIWVTIIEGTTAGEGKPMALWIVTGLTGAVGAILLLGASLKLAILAWIVAAALAALAVVFRATKPPARTSIAPILSLVAAVLTGLLISGVLYAKTPLVSAGILTLAAPFVIGVGGLALRRDFGRWKIRGTQLLVALFFAAASVGYAYYDTRIVEEEVDEDEYDPYTW